MEKKANRFIKNKNLSSVRLLAHAYSGPCLPMPFFAFSLTLAWLRLKKFDLEQEYLKKS